jgi:hypothetical protein
MVYTTGRLALGMVFDQVLPFSLTGHQTNNVPYSQHYNQVNGSVKVKYDETEPHIK